MNTVYKPEGWLIDHGGEMGAIVIRLRQRDVLFSCVSAMQSDDAKAPRIGFRVEL